MTCPTRTASWWDWTSFPGRSECSTKLTTTEQIRSLSERLEEAEETLRAVRSGEIDAFIVQGPKGEQIYALRSAEQPYRNLASRTCWKAPPS